MRKMKISHILFGGIRTQIRRNTRKINRENVNLLKITQYVTGLQIYQIALRGVEISTVINNLFDS